MKQENYLAEIGGTPSQNVSDEVAYKPWNDAIANELVKSPYILRYLSENGNKNAAFNLAYKYRYGDEENGIFIDRKAAKHCYELAGGEYDPKDDESRNDFPCYKTITAKGTEQELEVLKMLVNELTQRFGTPDNELGLYIPMDPMMKVLVGSPYYRGNLLYMDEDVQGELSLRVEMDDPYVLLYALRQAFPYLELEIKEE